MTGMPLDAAAVLLEAANGDLSLAVSLHFDSMPLPPSGDAAATAESESNPPERLSVAGEAYPTTQQRFAVLAVDDECADSNSSDDETIFPLAHGGSRSGKGASCSSKPRRSSRSRASRAPHRFEADSLNADYDVLALHADLDAEIGGLQMGAEEELLAQPRRVRGKARELARNVERSVPMRVPPRRAPLGADGSGSDTGGGSISPPVSPVAVAPVQAGSGSSSAAAAAVSGGASHRRRAKRQTGHACGTATQNGGGASTSGSMGAAWASPSYDEPGVASSVDASTALDAATSSAERARSQHRSRAGMARHLHAEGSSFSPTDLGLASISSVRGFSPGLSPASVPSVRGFSPTASAGIKIACTPPSAAACAASAAGPGSGEEPVPRGGEARSPMNSPIPILPPPGGFSRSPPSTQPASSLGADSGGGGSVGSSLGTSAEGSYPGGGSSGGRRSGRKGTWEPSSARAERALNRLLWDPAYEAQRADVTVIWMREEHSEARKSGAAAWSQRLQHVRCETKLAQFVKAGASYIDAAPPYHLVTEILHRDATLWSNRWMTDRLAPVPTAARADGAEAGGDENGGTASPPGSVWCGEAAATDACDSATSCPPRPMGEEIPSELWAMVCLRAPNRTASPGSRVPERSHPSSACVCRATVE